ncbi:hypothetical protein AVL50_16960 [Flammeovirga sp. SJP92]|nr:hypothetical protein AVL50_16960 [Flammeovirga sp. SJP92]
MVHKNQNEYEKKEFTTIRLANFPDKINSINRIDSIVVKDFFLDKYIFDPYIEPTITISTSLEYRLKSKIKSLNLYAINGNDTLVFKPVKQVELDNSRISVSWVNSDRRDTAPFLSCDISLFGGGKIYSFFTESEFRINKLKIKGTNSTAFRSSITGGNELMFDEFFNFKLIYGLLYDKTDCLKIISYEE